MKKFLKSYLNPDGKISSRRFTMLAGLLGLFIFSILRLFIDFPIEIIYTFGGLAVGTSASLIGK